MSVLFVNNSLEFTQQSIALSLDSFCVLKFVHAQYLYTVHTHPGSSFPELKISSYSILESSSKRLP